VTRIKKTGEIVYPVGQADSMHTYCLFKHPRRTKKGNLADIRPVKNDHLTRDGEV
jgi:hypothetical protein